MSSSGGKGGSAQKSLNYYGSLAVAFGWGPSDWLTAVIYNGNYLFKNDSGLTLTSDVTDLTGSLVDPTQIASGGSLKWFRGTETQPADDFVSPQAPDKGTIKLVARRLFFGQDTGQPGNLQAIFGARPRIDSSIVADDDNVVLDRQVNPIACLAEILTDDRGFGRPLAILDAASWLAAGHWCFLNAAYTFVSPLITDQPSGREIAKRLLDPFNGFLYWTNDGKLAVGIYEWGTNPGGLQTIDAATWVKKPKWTDGDWADIPTEIVVNYTDRDYEFQDQTVPVPNARALVVRQVDDSRGLDRKDVRRRTQAAAQGAEYIRRIGTAPSKGTLAARGPLVADLQVGDKVFVDVDPAAGGDGSAQLCRVDRIEQDASDKVMLTVQTDALLAPIAYTPAWAGPATPPDASVAPIAHGLAIPLPIDAFGWPPQAAFVAARASGDVRGFTVLIGDSLVDTFDELGSQHGFAVRATLAADIADTDASASLTQTDGVGGPDANLAADTPGGGTTAATDDQLLAIFATLDGNGRIALSGGVPVMEFVSIVSRSPVSGSTFSYDILRGRLTTQARAWSAATTAVWIVPRENLVAYDHGLLTARQGEVVYFQLLSFNDLVADDTSPYEADLNLPPIAAPTGLTATAGTGKTVKLKWSFVAFASYTGEFTIYRNTIDDFASASRIGQTTGDQFVDVPPDYGTLYYFFVVAQNPEEVDSAPSASASATTGTVRIGLLPAPAFPAPLTFDSEGTYGPTADGNIFAWMRFTLPGFPTGAAILNIYYRIDGSANEVLGDQKFPGDLTTRIDDLSCGLDYDFGVSALSADGEASAITWLGPITAPAKTSPPSGLTSIAAHSPDATWPLVARYTGVYGRYLMYGCTVSFVGPADLDYDGGEWTTQPTGVTPTGAGTPFGRKDSSVAYYDLTPFFASYFWWRTKNRSGVFTAWTNSAVNLTPSVALPAGTMSEQDASDVSVNRLSVAAASASSPTTIDARVDDQFVVTLTGGNRFEDFNVDITGRGVTSGITGGIGHVIDPPNVAMLATYKLGAAGNSNTNAVMTAMTMDGSNIVGGNYRFMFNLKQL